VLPTAAGYVTPSLSAADLLAMQDGAPLGSAAPVSSA
jgi:membrane-bound ClpP family serine protease